MNALAEKPNEQVDEGQALLLELIDHLSIPDSTQDYPGLADGVAGFRRELIVGTRKSRRAAKETLSLGVDQSSLDLDKSKRAIFNIVDGSTVHLSDDLDIDEEDSDGSLTPAVADRIKRQFDELMEGLQDLKSLDEFNRELRILTVMAGLNALKAELEILLGKSSTAFTCLKACFHNLFSGLNVLLRFDLLKLEEVKGKILMSLSVEHFPNSFEALNANASQLFEQVDDIFALAQSTCSVTLLSH